MSVRLLIGSVFLALSATAAETAAPPTAAQLEFFEKEVRPVLADNCYKCHGPKKQKSSLRLGSRELILKGGELGPVVVPGKPDLSRLILSINHAKGKDVYAMPGEDEKLPPKAIAALTEWVRQGLPWPTESYRSRMTRVSTGRSRQSRLPLPPSSLRPMKPRSDNRWIASCSRS